MRYNKNIQKAKIILKTDFQNNHILGLLCKMKPHILFEDTGLNSITFVNFGHDILIEITNIYNGNRFAHLLLKNVFKFVYSRDINDGGFSGSYLASIFITERENSYQLQF